MCYLIQHSITELIFPLTYGKCDKEELQTHIPKWVKWNKHNSWEIINAKNIFLIDSNILNLDRDARAYAKKIKSNGLKQIETKSNLRRVKNLSETPLKN